MKQKKPQVGDIAVCVFWDHSQGMPGALQFEVIGRITEITRKAYKFRTWGYVSDIDRAADGNSDNESWFHILKSAIDSIKVLK